MVILVRLFGVAVVVMGAIFAINQENFKKYLLFWKEKKSIKIGALVAIVLGVLFLIAAPQCRLTRLVTVIGVWSVIKGVLLLIIKQKKIDAYLDWWLARPVSIMRYLGFIAIAFGILFIYSA
ncbi:MAG: hypothetical protein ISS47_03130 [Candidatus Omnitrophica bacterium]|nr:hypothetical protein [Candidatus Omnitrophota bacterium]